MFALYSRTSMVRNLMACLPCLFRTRSWIPVVPYMRLLWSNLCIYVFVLLFSFSIFSDQWSLKIENENNNIDRRRLIYGTRVPRAHVYIQANPGWLELPLIRTNFHGSQPFRVIEALLYVMSMRVKHVAFK